MPEPGARALPVLGSRLLGPDLLALTLPRPVDYRFRAGQAAGLALAGESRLYSIASAPSASELEFLIRLDGDFPLRLRSLAAGQPLLVSQPQGSLALEWGKPRQLMIASGTGIAPFMSMLREHLSQGRPRASFHLVHGERHRDGFVFEPELRALCTRFPSHLRYRPRVSRPHEARNASWRGLTGRVESELCAYMQRHDLTPRNTLVYVCGRKETVAAVEARLAPLGYALRREAY